MISRGQSKHSQRFMQLPDAEAEELSTLITDLAADFPRTTSYFSIKVACTYGCIDLVTQGLIPFTVVKNSTYRKNIRYVRIDRKTLSKYMPLLTKRLVGKIRQLFLGKFAISFDVCTEGDRHYLAILTFIPQDYENRSRTFLLGFSPLEDQLTQIAEQNKRYIEYIVELFYKSSS